MKLSPLLCSALLLLAAPLIAQAAETAPDTSVDGYETPGSEARPYYREHRLRAFERTRATMIQGSTCVTTAMVCWIDKPALDGDTCSCETPELSVLPGVVGG